MNYTQKLDKKSAVKISEKFLEKVLPTKKWYHNIRKHIKAIMLYGSVAKGTNRPDSDIDLLIIVPLAIEKKYTKGEYSYTFQDYEINIVMRSIERLRLIADGKDGFQKTVFNQSQIIWQADIETEKLVQKITA